jgi:hypothetical protein
MRRMIGCVTVAIALTVTNVAAAGVTPAGAIGVKANARLQCMNGLVTVAADYGPAAGGSVGVKIAFDGLLVFRDRFRVVAGGQIAFDIGPPMTDMPVAQASIWWVDGTTTTTRDLGSLDCSSQRHVQSFRPQIAPAVHIGAPLQSGPFLRHGVGVSDRIHTGAYRLPFTLRGFPPGERPLLTYCNPYFGQLGLAACDPGVRFGIDAAGKAKFVTYSDAHFTGIGPDSTNPPFCQSGRSACFYAAIAMPNGKPDLSIMATAPW